MSYDRSKQAYFVKEGSSDEKGGHYVPRWQYLLSQLTPGDISLPFSYSDLLGQGQAAVPVLLSLLETVKASGDGSSLGGLADIANSVASQVPSVSGGPAASEGPKGDDEAQAQSDYKQLAIDILTSDLAILGYKTALSCVPGGPAILKAWETSSTIAEVAGIGNKFPRL